MEDELMKKTFLFLIAAAMLLTAGCGAQAPAATTVSTPEETLEATTEATEPQATTEALPETAEALVLADRVPAVLLFKDRGETLDIVGDYDEEHYVVKTEPGYGLVQKFLVRTEGQEPYESWKGFARYNTELHDDLYLRGEPAQILNMNTEVEVLEDLGVSLLVKLDETMGFVKKEQISRWRIEYSGGSDDSSESGGGSNVGQDGGDITLQSGGSLILLSIIEQTGEVTGTAHVLADGTPIILGYFERGDMVPVVKNPHEDLILEDYCLLYLNGLYAYVQIPMLQLPGSQPYEAWDGYVGVNAKCFGNFNLTGDPMTGIWTNVPVRVLADLGDCYLVEINANIGYMAKDSVSKTQIPIYSGGSDSSDSSSDSGGKEWSDPVL